MAGGRARAWMGLALGSVLVLGLSAGLLADRLLVDRDGERDGRRDRSHAHGAGPEMLHFDCRSREENEASATGGLGPAEQRRTIDADRLREHSARAAERLGRRLELEPEQIEALEPIVADAMSRSRVYWRGARDEFCAMQMHFHQQVSELLSPDQAARFDEWTAKLAERGQRHGSGHPGDRNRDGEDSGGCR